MTKCDLDHIVVGATSLEEGVAFIRERLGVDMPAGGKHPHMGTHNRLMRIGEAVFLEVIAIDPEAPKPDRHRWFALDDAAMQMRLKAGPQVISWVSRSPDIEATAQSASYALGRILPLSRGHLNWLFAVPDDGMVHEGGVLPHVLQWDKNLRPWEQMADLGCRMAELILHHPQPETIGQALQSLNPEGFSGVTVQAGQTPMLSLRVTKPDGTTVTL